MQSPCSGKGQVVSALQALKVRGRDLMRPAVFNYSGQDDAPSSLAAPSAGPLHGACGIVPGLEGPDPRGLKLTRLGGRGKVATQKAILSIPLWDPETAGREVAAQLLWNAPCIRGSIPSSQTLDKS